MTSTVVSCAQCCRVEALLNCVYRYCCASADRVGNGQVRWRPGAKPASVVVACGMPGSVESVLSTPCLKRTASWTALRVLAVQSLHRSRHKFGAVCYHLLQGPLLRGLSMCVGAVRLERKSAALGF